ncbi:TetR/AcrR family transcriptional regulator [Mycobacterium sp. M1]|uniref:TetR/AcrR family transcriptional regulator n=1 Tax=Mycolicibacter acidiphilus TaxID=2835306 RepID=A0ABS5RQ88_9MYCO|nr:TetR/AcrR family transcriptional regulator [Mycolicibacter acidiphilus]MBS9535129.1 TetR/AcrR family transcriptional regulator [Mycolicibacter acidiphilus]
MAGPDWLADDRTELAAEKILDAAAQLFAERDPASVGMHEIANAAGCSRATLYRYFESREVLHLAYVHRWAHALYQLLTERLSSLDDPHERLVTGILEALAMIRENPSLASWFAEAGPPIGGTMAEQSEIVATMICHFLIESGSPGGEVVQRRARWVVRVMTSLLSFPGRDRDDERMMLEQFLVPVVTGRVRSSSRPVP